MGLYYSDINNVARITIAKKFFLYWIKKQKQTKPNLVPSASFRYKRKAKKSFFLGTRLNKACKLWVVVSFLKTLSYLGVTRNLFFHLLTSFDVEKKMEGKLQKRNMSVK